MGKNGHADFDAVIIGAGVSGLYQLHRFREAGLSTLVKLGLPIGLNRTLGVASWAVFCRFIADAGEEHLAAHTVVMRVISVSFLAGHGISEAACILAGQAKGAGSRRQRALLRGH